MKDLDQQPIVSVIDALLARDLLAWTRSDLLGFRAKAVAGILRAEDEGYVRSLYRRLQNKPEAPPRCITDPSLSAVTTA